MKRLESGRGVIAALVLSALLVAGASLPASGAEAAGKTPTTILASQLSLSGLSYGGIVDVATSGGSVKAMEFAISGLELSGDVKVSMPRGNGRALRISGPRAKLSTPWAEKSTLHVRQLKGKLKLGPVEIPVDFTPENPPPLTFPWLKFTDVTIGVYTVLEGDLDVASPHLDVNAKHIALPAPTMIPAPPVDGDPGGGAAAPSNCAQVTGPVTAAATTLVSGIRVHRCLASPLRRLLADAKADGVVLSGGGFRSYASQIQLRRAHCGTSDYAIYEMPSSRCRPPTATPGASMHERGLAVDFTVGGSIITSRSSKAFRWLSANAGKYGLRNLPSEPWHWSTNGR